MSLSRSPTWMHRAGSPSSVCRLAHVFQPADALLVLDRHPRRIDLLLERGAALELLPRPEFDGRQAQRQPFRRDRQARMHQKPAHRVHPETAGFVLAAVDPVGDADLLGPLPLVGKLRRVLEHQDRPTRRGKAALGRLKMTCQDLCLTDPLIGEEAISRLGVCPILAGQSADSDDFARSFRDHVARCSEMISLAVPT